MPHSWRAMQGQCKAPIVASERQIITAWPQLCQRISEHLLEGHGTEQYGEQSSTMECMHLCVQSSIATHSTLHAQQSIYICRTTSPRQGLANSEFTLKVFSGSYQNKLTSLCIQKGRVLAGNPAVPTKLLLLPTLVVCLV